MNEPLLFLPGMMCDARLFAPQIAALSHARPIMTAVMTGHDRIETLAAGILVNAPPRFALAGLSLGGLVAMEMIRQAPERITRLALMDTNPKSENPDFASQRDPQIAKVQAGHLRRVMQEEMIPHYLADGPDGAQIADLCMDMAETFGPQVFADQSRALQTRPDQQDTLQKIKVPALILCGEDDRLCPLHRHELMHGLIPGSTLSVIKGAGHLPTLEQPDTTNMALAHWLKRSP